jgi:hypothetical protein
MIYEWRTYEAMPGKLPALHTHLGLCRDTCNMSHETKRPRFAANMA